MDLPQVAPRAEWLSSRLELLESEKELTRMRDVVAAQRRSLPMVEIEKKYVFEGAGGTVSLLDLFEGRRQLIVYHFMWRGEHGVEGCTSCSCLVDHMGHLSHLNSCDTTLALVSRAPLEKLMAFQERMGWTVPWYSSLESDFSVDLHASQDESIAPIEYNYMDKETLESKGQSFFTTGDGHAASVFLREGDRVFHTYSTYGRGLDLMVGAFNYLDLTPSGRTKHISQFVHHDRY